MSNISNIPNHHEAIRVFITNVQRFNALQFNAKCHKLIETFGEDKGIKFVERFEKYGLWFFVHELTDDEQSLFFSMVLRLE